MRGWWEGRSCDLDQPSGGGGVRRWGKSAVGWTEEGGGGLLLRLGGAQQSSQVKLKRNRKKERGINQMWQNNQALQPCSTQSSSAGTSLPAQGLVQCQRLRLPACGIRGSPPSGVAARAGCPRQRSAGRPVLEPARPFPCALCGEPSQRPTDESKGSFP